MNWCKSNCEFVRIFLQTQRKFNSPTTEKAHILSAPLHSSLFRCVKDTWNASASLPFRRPLLFALHCGICSLGHAALGRDSWLLWKQLSLQAAQHNSLCLDCVIVWPELFFFYCKIKCKPLWARAASSVCSFHKMPLSHCFSGNSGHNTGYKTFCITAYRWMSLRGLVHPS